MKLFSAISNLLKPILEKAGKILEPLIKKFSNTRSIRTKLILAFLVPIFLIIFQGLLSWINASGAVKAIASNTSQTAMMSSGKYLDVVFRTLENQTVQMFASSDVQGYFSKDFTDEDMYDKIELSTNINNNYINLSSLNTDVQGLMMLSNKESTPSLSTNAFLFDLKDATFLKTLDASASGGGWFGYHKELDTLNSSTSDNYAVSFMKYIKSLTSMETIGLLVVDIKTDTITDLIDSIELGKNQLIHFVTPDGRVITNGKDDSKSDLLKQGFFTNIRKSEAANGTETIRYHGTSYLMTYYKIGTSGCILMGFLPESELNSAAKGIVVTTIIMILIAGLIALGTGYAMANSMTRTINRTINASECAASGDLSVSFNSRRQDELGTLARSISSMIASMRSLIEQTLTVSGKVTESVQIVSSTSQHVSSVSSEISRAIEEISGGASAQASDAENGVKKISELAEKIGRVTDSAKSIDSLTKTSMQLTESGLASVNDLDSKSNETTAISREIMADIKELDLHSKSIGKIVKVISGIADQTNMLALNAAIEAARAGEMGKGFAVVADQVRNLAEQSMNATREITSIIKNTQDKTAKAVEKAASTESILNSQNNAVLGTIEVFQKIMASMNHLSVQVEQIMSMITEMEENKEQAINSIQNISAVSEETAASSQEVTASTQEQLASIDDLASKAEDLRKAADDLQQNISRFKLN